MTEERIVKPIVIASAHRENAGGFIFSRFSNVVAREAAMPKALAFSATARSFSSTVVSGINTAANAAIANPNQTPIIGTPNSNATANETPNIAANYENWAGKC